MDPFFDLALTKTSVVDSDSFNPDPDPEFQVNSISKN
jgi:hypothetical protein